MCVVRQIKYFTLISFNYAVMSVTLANFYKSLEVIILRMSVKNKLTPDLLSTEVQNLVYLQF